MFVEASLGCTLGGWGVCCVWMWELGEAGGSDLGVDLWWCAKIN